MSPDSVPAIIADTGDHAAEQYRAFFTAFGNPATRRASQVQAERFFHWAEARELSLASIHAFDAVFYVEDLKQSGLADPSVALYRSQVARLFEHLKNAGVITENPFNAAAPAGVLAADSIAAVEWQAVVDAAEVALIIDNLQQAGLIQSGTPVNKDLSEKVIALGNARGIAPNYDALEIALAALFRVEATDGPGPEAKDDSPAAGQADSDGQ